jgi:hypothetical protein
MLRGSEPIESYTLARHVRYWHSRTRRSLRGFSAFRGKADLVRMHRKIR